MLVRMFNPTTLQQATKLAKLHEAASSNPHKPQPKSYQPPHSSYPSKPSPPKPPFLKPPFTPQRNPNTTPSNQWNQKPLLLKQPRRLTPTEIEEKKAKGLCFICDEPFTPGHHLKHKRAQLFVIEGEEDSERKDEGNEDVVVDQEVIEEVPHILVHAMAGSNHFQTMRVTGTYNKKPLHILIDSGSTQNFLDERVAKKLGCKMVLIKPSSVSVADGNVLVTKPECKHLKWVLQNTKFEGDFKVLSLGFCDMVLGVQWLQTLGPILWDFKTLSMEFTYKGRRHVLRGSMASSFKEVRGKQIAKTLQHSPELAMLWLLPSEHVQKGVNQEEHTLFTLNIPDDNEEVPTELEGHLSHYACLFEEPQGLPPHSPGYDHQIPLIEGTQPINKRPHHYPRLSENCRRKVGSRNAEQGGNTT